ncbi:DUF2238 domain-containing protein [Porticoccus sp.]|uniref:DUF2238 domain-containing protein n=1 Tax=Porticoccus sp. TaxID=2024853 RepID=UPI003F696472
MAVNRELLWLLVVLLAVLVWSWIEPFDRATWWLEAIPVLMALPVLYLTRRGFPLTRLSYHLIFLHAVILLVGAHYTYARVPLGFLVADWFDFTRNHYDRFGHLAQGFVPAILAREVLWRNRVVVGRYWLFFLVTCFCLAFSAFYELLEWLTAVVGGDGSVEFLGTQGDVWDTQWDMFIALLGAISAQLLLGGWHDRQMAVVTASMKH